MKALPVATAIGLLFVGLSGQAQPSSINTLDSIAARLLRSNDASPSVYVHIDKQVQVAGSTFWFKVYLYHHSTRLPYAGGVNVYADLVDAADSTIRHLILESADINLDGGIQLPRELKPGYYFLRVYTAEMMMNSPQNICINPVYITNPLFPQQSTPPSICFTAYKKRIPGTGIQFYPEGNHLINGVDNLVVITTHDKEGKPVATRGIIKDTRDSIVANFATDNQGIGSFNLFPYKARKYKAIVESASLPQKEAQVPDVPISAYQLSLVKQDSSNYYFRVALSDLLYNSSPSSYFVGMSAGRICFTASGKGMYNLTVPKKPFNAGVCEFFLFDEKQQLVSRRYVHSSRKNIKLLIEPDKESYFARATVKLNISVKDDAGKPVSALLSVAVTDNKSLPFGSPISFSEFNWQQFLDNGQQPGNYMFEPTAGDRDRALIIHGRESPLQVDESKALAMQEDAGGILIAGRLFNEEKKPVTNQPILLLSADQPAIFFSDTTDSQGNFSFPGVRFFDSTRMMLYAEAKNQKPKDWSIILIRDTVGPSPTKTESVCFADSLFRPAILAFETSRADTFLTGNTKVWLQEVVVKGKVKKSQTGGQVKHGGRVITREQLSKQTLGNTANAVKMVPGVMMVQGKITIRGGIPSLSGSASMDNNIEPMVIVDGVQSAAQGGVENYLNTIPPENIDYIEVLTGPEASMYGTRAGNGVIIVKTGQPTSYFKDMNNLLSFYPKGYHLAPTFYQPEYSNDAVKDADFRDNRSTIYWNGNLITDENGKVMLQFYSADPRTRYTVIIRGLTSKGNVIDEQIVINRE